MKKYSIKSALLYGQNFLEEKGIVSYQTDSRVLLMEVCKMDRIQLCIMPEKLLADDEFLKYNTVLEERGRNKPISYILNRCEFMSLDFYVNEEVLIPRPDTEILVERVIEKIAAESYQSLLDIGTGSGCIPISIGHYSSLKQISAVDISPEALAIAKKNADLNNIAIDFILGNLFDNVQKKYDVIVSNPPYIQTTVIETLESNVKDFEPLLALDGGADGMKFYKEIATKARHYLNPNGMLFFEIGYDQAKSVSSLLAENRFCCINVLKDLATLDRVVYGRIE